MGDDMVIVTINGTDYYCPADYVDYICEVSNTLTLNHSGSVTLYGSLRSYNSSTSGYPRISLSFGQTGRYTATYNSTQVDLTLNDWEIKQDHSVLSKNSTSIILMIAILITMLWSLMKGK